MEVATGGTVHSREVAPADAEFFVLGKDLLAIERIPEKCRARKEDSWNFRVGMFRGVLRILTKNGRLLRGRHGT